MSSREKPVTRVGRGLVPFPRLVACCVRPGPRAPRFIKVVSRPNKRMHATRISEALKLDQACGRVMRSVRTASDRREKGGACVADVEVARLE